ncbi:hypothetical protein GQ53DRAFT_817284 [Thozetella sp. PMI_491]|nr:hypothetical protein GQ53DRAFT_817284 [Thozetella sp. PMI_491]
MKTIAITSTILCGPLVVAAFEILLSSSIQLGLYVDLSNNDIPFFGSCIKINQDPAIIVTHVKFTTGRRRGWTGFSLYESEDCSGQAAFTQQSSSLASAPGEWDINPTTIRSVSRA